MASTDERGGALLARFAEFYEEIASLKQAMATGQLSIYLAGGSEAGSLTVHDLAALMSHRLQARLQEQRRRVAVLGTQAEIASYRIAQYAMAALADELFLMEIDWPGRDAWQQHLLEQRLFGSTHAGRNFFRHLDELLASRAVSPLEEELAAVFLMSLRLGFQGQWRGSRGERQLKEYNTKLIRFIGSAAPSHQASFRQAYQYRIAGAKDERLAPLSRWYKLGALGLVVYLLISTAVWLALTDRFMRVFTG